MVKMRELIEHGFWSLAFKATVSYISCHILHSTGEFILHNEFHELSCLSQCNPTLRKPERGAHVTFGTRYQFSHVWLIKAVHFIPFALKSYITFELTSILSLFLSLCTVSSSPHQNGDLKIKHQITNRQTNP